MANWHQGPPARKVSLPIGPAEKSACATLLGMQSRSPTILDLKSIRTWKRGDQRAVHKPLLLLIALGRVQRGCPRLMTFTEIEDLLRGLLEAYGPFRERTHPEYPFWRLKNDGFWEVPNSENMETRKSNTDAKLTELRRLGTGGFLPYFDRRLREDGEALAAIARLILTEHFPTPYHAPVATDAKLDLELRRVETSDTGLRGRVVRQFNESCSCCGCPSLLAGTTSGLEVHHVCWLSHSGAASLENSLCLCPDHASAFVFGALSVGLEQEVLVSPRLSLASPLVALRGRRITNAGRFDPANFRWHREQVFKGPC